MSQTQSIPSVHRKLTNAIRHALFTSVAVSSSLAFAPAALAQNITPPATTVGEVNAATSKTVADETVDFEVADLTKVAAYDGLIDPIDVHESGTEEVYIGNSGDIEAGNAEVVGADQYEKTYTDVGFTESLATQLGVNTAQFVIIGTMNTREDGTQVSLVNPVQRDLQIEAINADDSLTDEEKSEQVAALLAEPAWDNVDEHLAVTFGPNVTPDDVIAELEKAGFELTDEEKADVIARMDFYDNREDITIVVAPEGALTTKDSIGISASSDSGNILIENSGDIAVGSGDSVTYLIDGTVEIKTGFSQIDTFDKDADDLDDTAIMAYGRRIHSATGAHTLTVSATAIQVESVSGDIEIENDGALTIGDRAKGISVTTQSGDVEIDNTGDLATGYNAQAISVGTGSVVKNVFQYDHTWSETETVKVDGNDQKITREHIYNDITFYNVDSSDTEVTIENSGALTVGAGSNGVFGHNPSGDSVSITNTGDVTLTEGIGGGAIVASTVNLAQSYYNEIDEDKNKTVVAEGAVVIGSKFVDNEEVMLYSEVTYKYYHNVREYVGDRGDIEITNDGDIDLAAATQAVGIYTAGNGSTNIVNNGDLIISKDSVGIMAAGLGETYVGSNGDINLTESGSVAINVNHVATYSSSNVEVGAVGVNADVITQFAGQGEGDATIINSGDIELTQDNTTAEFTKYVYNDLGEKIALAEVPFTTTGIQLTAMGANVSSTATVAAHYGRGDDEVLGASSVVFSKSTIINDGDIKLGDKSNAISVKQRFGEVEITNNATIEVGKGFHHNAPETYNAFWVYSHGIRASNSTVEGFASHRIINSETGVIITGDLGQGIFSQSWHGASYVKNDGYIKVGNGHTVGPAEGGRDSYNHRHSIAMTSAVAGGLDAYSVAINNGEIVTGEMAHGIFVSNVSTTKDNFENVEYDYTASAKNFGTVTTGDNANGMVIFGLYAYGLNEGDITIGSNGPNDNNLDIFDRGAGMRALGNAWSDQNGGIQSALINKGSITGGEYVSGMENRAVFAGTINFGQGIIETGDDSFGMSTVGLYQAYTVNAGVINVGNESDGMRAESYASNAINVGELQFGNQSSGMHTLGLSGTTYNSGTLTGGSNSIGINVESIAVANTEFSTELTRTMVNENNETVSVEIYSRINGEDGNPLVLIADSDGIFTYSDESGEKYSTQKIVDEDGNAILTNDGLEQAYVIRSVNQSQVRIGSLSQQNINNSGTIDATNGISISGDNKRLSTGFSTTGVELTFADKATLGTAYNDGVINAVESGIVVENLNQALLVNRNEINADIGFEISVNAINETEESALSFSPVMIDGKESYVIVEDENGELVSRVQLEADMIELRDENGFLMQDQFGDQIMVQEWDTVTVEAVSAVAQVINEGVMNSRVGVQAHVDGAEVGNGTLFIANYGQMLATEDAVVITGDVNTTIVNTGSITGDITTTAGDDVFDNNLNAARTAAGQVVLENNTFDFGAGTNVFNNTFGDISFAGNNVINLGEFGEMNHYSATDSYVSITSINGSSSDELRVIGDMNFLTTGTNAGLVMLEVGMDGNDQFIIEGDLKVGTEQPDGEFYARSLNVAIAPAGQLKGEASYILLSNDEADGALVTATGEQTLKDISFAGGTGSFSGTIVDTEEVEENGQQVLKVSFGLSSLGATASSISHMASSYWAQSIGNHFTRRSDSSDGFSATVDSFHTDSDMAVAGDVAAQDLTFAQRMSGLNVSAQYKVSDLTFGFSVGQGNADSSQSEQQSTASLDMTSVAISVGYTLGEVYLDAVLNQTKFEGKLTAYDSSARTKGEVLGGSIEAGYKLELFGYNVIPHVQLLTSEVSSDGFTDSTTAYNYAFDNDVSQQIKAGVHLDKYYELSTGSVTPYATLNVVSTAAENQVISNDVSFLSDISGTGYQFDAGVNAVFKEWSIKSLIGIYDGEANKNGFSIGFSAGYRW
ncbi:autotransporter outer membrane beta-barrel domain-containing protein [Psychrosphaera algicola]|uniref:Autotransporter domain-containing protein n=1 Tax=Psychrosphaera algicola TaxID=3023714 RepID=A0ABT5FBH5_9GAMM|nr:autotransporter outer membrane beta-barrel domain-containing protein [Psychrosphaera sp. G1-22]MDC2888746.1 hypothetical protein [Psychrosphaera sp. G1-22]